MFFEFSQKTKDLQERLSAFMDTYIYPNEAEFHRQVREGDPWKVIPLIEELKEKARRFVESFSAGKRAWRRSHQPGVCTVVRDHGARTLVAGSLQLFCAGYRQYGNT
jgi:hypothetical protein